MLSLLALSLVFHVPLLQGLHRQLTYDEPNVTTDYVVVVFGDKQSMDQAARAIKEGLAKQVWIMELRWPRIVQLGLAPTLGETVKAELLKQGVAEPQVEIVLTQAANGHAAWRAMQDKLGNKTAAILCPHDRTRAMRWTVDSALANPVARTQWQVRSIPVYGYEESRWWLSRYGWKRVGSNLFRLCYLGLIDRKSVV